MHLGIDNHGGLVYEGLNNPELPVVPTPHVTQAKIINSEEDWKALPAGLAFTPFAWIFREDSFDAVTRTRRGRLYSAQAQAQPSSQQVAPHPYEDPFGRQVGYGGRQMKNLFTYMACSELLNFPNQGLGSTVALGSSRAVSAWRIIQSEVLANGCVMVTLKALTAFGLVPEFDGAKTLPEHRAAIAQGMERVLDSAFKESPISVIDHCRNALTIILSRWLVAQGQEQSVLGEDLGRLATLVGKAPYEMGCLANLASVVARLHSRGKGNEQHKYGVPAPIEEDAQLAIEIVGFTLREVGWAKA